ncbi:MAG: VanW family protein [Akkermansiaceae bacterium]
MPSDVHRESELPTRWEGVVFGLKAAVFRFRRSLIEWGERPPVHRPGSKLCGAGVLGEAEALLWSQVSEAEFPLTAGKVENLRVSARALHGLEIPEGEVFSFWRQLGRTTKSRGYTAGRELREGCMVPNVGGGLCQITGLLYQAALQAGLEIVERHAHSRLVEGSMGEKNLDATVFWNYVDLRFRADFPWRLEVVLDATHLRVKILARTGKAKPTKPEVEEVSREAPTGDCLTCNQTSCFRHPSAVGNHAPSMGHSAFLLDARWPEFDRWCQEHSRDGDRWLMPLDGKRWKKRNYAWSVPAGAMVRQATWRTLWRSFRQRHLPLQGAERQKALLERDRELANWYARRISPECRHLVVAQNLLPHLWQLGVLGGRTFDVLVTRWPLESLLSLLDEAVSKHPVSPTLGDFRPDPELVKWESEALAEAGKLVTPHRAIAKKFGSRAWLLDWDIPEVEERKGAGIQGRFFLPCSPLGRKGVYELLEAFEGRDDSLVVLGSAREDALPDFFEQGGIEDLTDAEALLLPAWVEHQPRLALKALAMGIPVVASEACGLPDHQKLTTLKSPSELIEWFRGCDSGEQVYSSGMSENSGETMKLEAGTHWMCTCGKSDNFPFCDGSHKGSGKGPEKLVLEEATEVPVERPSTED